MGEIVNLRRFRKRAAKQAEDERAATNRALHGRSKADRALDAMRADKSRRDVEAHKIEPGDAQ